MAWSVGAPIEDTVALVQLILKGIPSRYPNIRIIASHLGGALPVFLPRLDHKYQVESPDTPELPSKATPTASSTFRAPPCWTSSKAPRPNRSRPS
jgi:aminocarboxymuconate-semialdehyde decarboxylase